jgi:ribosomal protein L29
MKVLAPEMYPILEVVVKQYINLRYRMNTKGSKKGTVQLKEFKRDIKRLSAML